MEYPSISINLANKLLAKVLAEGRSACLVDRFGKKDSIPHNSKSEFIIVEAYDSDDNGGWQHSPKLDKIVLQPHWPEHLETTEIHEDSRWWGKPVYAFQVERLQDGSPSRIYRVH